MFTKAELETMPIHAFPNWKPVYSQTVIDTDGLVVLYGEFLAEKKGFAFGGLRAMLIAELESWGCVA